MDAEAATPAAYRGVRSLYTHADTTYSLYPTLVRAGENGPVTTLCPFCLVAHKKGVPAEFSAHMGLDLGNIGALGLPKLGLAEMFCISLQRLLMLNVNLNVGKGNYATTRGHAASTLLRLWL